jgi:uncharacterized protein YceK
MVIMKSEADMKRIIWLVIFVVLLSGCRSIHIGGSGGVGDITAGGGVNIPIPKTK